MQSNRLRTSVFQNKASCPLIKQPRERLLPVVCTRICEIRHDVLALAGMPWKSPRFHRADFKRDQAAKRPTIVSAGSHPARLRSISSESRVLTRRFAPIVNVRAPNECLILNHHDRPAEAAAMPRGAMAPPLLRCNSHAFHCLADQPFRCKPNGKRPSTRQRRAARLRQRICRFARGDGLAALAHRNGRPHEPCKVASQRAIFGHICAKIVAPMNSPR